ncbi:Mu transposase C-terminal domain-containing protein [Streptomyces sp. NPDC002176]|uniref:Mu transposase C-terminal domain-containing protein n=1 Tax=Streptomyces sp. NPDC002176 TaxID=3364634 RepID=UPI00384EFD46
MEGHVPLPLGVHENRKLLPYTRLKVTRKGVKINNRTYNSRELQQYHNRHSGIRGQGMKWLVRYNPYAPRFVWLYDHTKGAWVEAEFVHQRLIGDAWTQYLWERAEAAHVELGGSKNDERAITRAVAALREHARRGPQPSAPRAPDLFTGPKLSLHEPRTDRYAGIRAPVPGMVRRAPSLNVPAGDLFPRPSSPATEAPTAVPPQGMQQAMPADTPSAARDGSEERPLAAAAPPQRAAPAVGAARQTPPRSITGPASGLFAQFTGAAPRPAVPDTEAAPSPAARPSKETR